MSFLPKGEIFNTLYLKYDKISLLVRARTQTGRYTRNDNFGEFSDNVLVR